MATLAEAIEKVQGAIGLDLTDATEVGTYVGILGGVRRWLLHTPNNEWVLLWDPSDARTSDLKSGRIGSAIFLASTPLVALSLDIEFNAILYSDVYNAAYARMTEYGVNDTPYITMANLDTTQGGMISGFRSMSGWDRFDVVVDPVGTDGSGITFVMSEDGNWTGLSRPT